ncbi:hypothetical protein [Planctomicrobium sp. SH664]|uniref:hypothetical protein n=1 Tax=Planctomicrobium sp. SH664 TaxID=3448125 RepID=UPI003F5B2CDA
MSTPPTFRPLLCCLSLFCLATLSACHRANSWQAKTYPAQGRILINGEPRKHAIITLHPLQGQLDVRESKPWGISREDGTFRLRTYQPDDGVPPGEYRVTVVLRQDAFKADFTDLLGGEYDKPDSSPWTVRIEAGNNELPVIEIQSDKLQAALSNASKRPRPRTPFDTAN